MESDKELYLIPFFVGHLDPHYVQKKKKTKHNKNKIKKKRIDKKETPYAVKGKITKKKLCFSLEYFKFNREPFLLKNQNHCAMKSGAGRINKTNFIYKI